MDNKVVKYNSIDPCDVITFGIIYKDNITRHSILETKSPFIQFPPLVCSSISDEYLELAFDPLDKDSGNFYKWLNSIDDFIYNNIVGKEKQRESNISINLPRKLGDNPFLKLKINKDTSFFNELKKKVDMKDIEEGMCLSCIVKIEMVKIDNYELNPIWSANQAKVKNKKEKKCFI